MEGRIRNTDVDSLIGYRCLGGGLVGGREGTQKDSTSYQL